MKSLGIPGVFGGVASAELLWDSYGMDAESIAKTAKKLMN